MLVGRPRTRYNGGIIWHVTLFPQGSLPDSYPYLSLSHSRPAACCRKAAAQIPPTSGREPRHCWQVVIPAVQSQSSSRPSLTYRLMPMVGSLSRRHTAKLKIQPTHRQPLRRP